MSGGNMAIDAPEVGRSTRQHDDWLTRRWRLTGRLVVLLWLGVLLSAALGGEKESALHDLESALYDGSVREVEVVGLPRGSGRVTVDLRWEGRFVDRYAEVVVVSGRRADASMTAWGRDLPEFGEAALVERLRHLRPDVQLTYADHHRGTDWQVISWRVPRWLGVTSLFVWLSTLVLVTAGPQPWRATRAAWFWLILLGGWVGVAAFVLLGGPLGLGRPRQGSRRLTGGWAFLLALFIGGGRT